MSDNRTVIRRKDRAVEDEAWIRAFLHRAPVGMLAMVQDGEPYLHTNLFVYDEAAHAIYWHTAKTGRTRTSVEADARVCFTVTEMGRLLPADVALEFSMEYASVIVFGRARIIEDEASALDALQKLMDKYAPHLRPGPDYRPPVESELLRTAVYGIDIERWTAKKKEVAADFPGAYWYPTEPMLESLRRRDGRE